MMQALKSFPFIEKLNELGELKENDYADYCRFLELDIGLDGQYIFQRG
jgi:hypothetical protein